MNDSVDAVAAKGLTIADSQSGMMPIELFTQSCKIAGHMARGQVRMSDVLNQMDRPFLTIESATITYLFAEMPAAEAAKLQVSRHAVVLAVPCESTTAKPTTSGGRPTLAVAKQPHRVVVEAPPFSIAGSVHLLRETQVHDALLTIPSHFVPITGATITIPSAPDRSFTAQTVIVNRSFIHLFYGVSAPIAAAQSARVLLKRLS